MIISALSAFGMGLSTFGKMCNMPPFSSAFTLVGRLCLVAKDVHINTVNCNIVRRRMIALLPILSTLWKRCQVATTEASLRMSIHTVVDSLSHTIAASVNEVQKYSARGGILGSTMRVFKNSEFKENVDKLLKQIDADLATLQAGMLTDQMMSLDKLLEESRLMRVEVWYA